MRTFLIILTPLLIAVQLQGCTGMVVGGMATGAVVIHDRRTMGSMLDDQEIELKALNLKQAQQDLHERSSISVTSYNQVVLLTGEADTRSLSRDYAERVSRIQRVKKVHNEVVVGPSGTLLDRSNDVYLTTKVKLALFDVDLKEFDSTRVKVVTSQGTVYLMGLLTPQEADAVVEKARFVNGVKRVVKVFEYI